MVVMETPPLQGKACCLDGCSLNAPRVLSGGVFGEAKLWFFSSDCDQQGSRRHDNDTSSRSGNDDEASGRNLC